MNNVWRLRLAWGIALGTFVGLVMAAVISAMSPDHSSKNWLEILVGTLVNLAAPILGLIIVRKQPDHRIGWLLLVYGVLLTFKGLGYAIYYFNDAQATGYSAWEYFLLWATEATNVPAMVCMGLFLLWFPDGQLLSRRWRFLYLIFLLSLALIYQGLFAIGTEWNGGVDAGGIVIDNPFGLWPLVWIGELPIGFFGFIGVVFSIIVATISLIVRYRSADHLTRLQIRWFVVGGLLYTVMDFGPVFFIDITNPQGGLDLVLTIIGFADTLPLYLAVGLAILRYRLYDIDVIVRKTVQYGVVTAVLALVYFGTIILLQSLVGQATGEQSPIIIVLSTLLIAALFNPLRRRVQTAIDRRFYRQKYDAQQVLTQFAQTARDETDMAVLQSELLKVVQETMQPKTVALWLIQEKRGREL